MLACVYREDRLADAVIKPDAAAIKRRRLGAKPWRTHEGSATESERVSHTPRGGGLAPAALMQAIAIYRERFEASVQLDRPYVMSGMNVVAADTDEEAHFLRTSVLQSFVNLRRGMPDKLPVPVADFEDHVMPHERAMLEAALSCSAVGAPATVEREIAAFVEQTRADEIMITSNIHDHAKRLRSFELVAEMMGSASALQRTATPRQLSVATPSARRRRMR